MLPRNECLRLLALRAGRVGRLGVNDAGEVIIQPVNYRMLGPDLLVQIGPGLMLDAVRRQDIVSFEFDEVDVDKREAWSVLVRGLATVLEEHAEGSPPESRPASARPLVPEPGLTLVRIRTGILSGRRFSLSDTALSPDGGRS